MVLRAALRSIPAAYDPHYHYQMAIDAGLSAYAAPLANLEAGADTFAGQIPTILKVNSANSLMSGTAAQDQAVTASVNDALRLGCSAIGFTIYPGCDLALDMFEEIREMRAEAASCGIATVIWSYPRGEALTKDGETAIDVTAYAAHIAAMLGAHIIKVKLSTDHLEQAEAKKVYRKGKDRHLQPGRPRAPCGAVVLCRAADRGVLGGAAKGEDAVTTTPARSATAAATAASSGATAFSARAKRRWRCWTSWWKSTRAAPDRRQGDWGFTALSGCAMIDLHAPGRKRGGRQEADTRQNDEQASTFLPRRGVLPDPVAP